MRSALLAAGVVLLTVAETRAADPPCNVLTPADVKAVTGQEVQPLARGESPGAGGCANFKSSDGHAFLGVDRHRGVGAYQTAVGSVPKDVYPQRTQVPGLGDEAVLMKDDTGRMRYLVARRANHHCPVSAHLRQGHERKGQYKISDAQLQRSPNGPSRRSRPSGSAVRYHRRLRPQRPGSSPRPIPWARAAPLDLGCGHPPEGTGPSSRRSSRPWNSCASAKSTPVDQAKVMSPEIAIIPSRSRHFTGRSYSQPSVV